MASNVFYLVFIPGFTITAFLIGALIMLVTMSARVEPEDKSDSQPGHQ